LGFPSLQHLRNRESTYRGLCLPATFRLQGLVTLLAAYSSRSRAGLISYQQRSWDSPFGAFSSRKVSDPFPDQKNPHTVPPVGIPAPEGTGRLDRPRFLGCDPSESPWRSDALLAHPTLDAPLGFALLGPATKALARISPSLLSRASTAGCEPDVRRLRVSIGSRSATTCTAVTRGRRLRQPF
jgi:hypothetical protein